MITWEIVQWLQSLCGDSGNFIVASEKDISY